VTPERARGVGPVWGALLLASIAAVHLGLLYAYWVPGAKPLTGDELVYDAAARRLLAARPSGLDLLWPPLYPHFLAGLRMLGRGHLLAVQLAQTLLLLATALVLRDLMRRFVPTGPAPDLVGFFAAAYPPLVAFCHYLWPEVLHLFLAWVVAWVLVAKRRSFGWLAVAGGCAGLALLSKSLLLFFLPVLLLPLLGSAGKRVELAGLCRVGLVLAVAGAVIAPTVLGNWRQHHMPMIAEPVAFNLWVGLNDKSPRNFVDPIVVDEVQAYLASSRDSLERRRILARKIRALVSARGPGLILERAPIQYRRLFHRDSFLTDQLPGGGMEVGYRETPPLLAAGIRLGSYAFYAVLLVLGATGLALFAPGPPWLRMALAFLLYNLLIFLALHVKTRYRIQILPVFFLGAGLATHWFWSWRRGAAPFPPALRWVAALAGSGLLLGLAFA